MSNNRKNLKNQVTTQPKGDGGVEILGETINCNYQVQAESYLLIIEFVIFLVYFSFSLVFFSDYYE